MTGSVLDCAGVDVVSDPSAATWRVTAGGRAFTIREWTWGERRRLVADAVVDQDGATFLDPDRFAAGFTRLLADPRPEPEMRPVLAAVGLRLLGVRPGQRPPSLLDSEAALAGAFHWGPVEMDGQPAPRLDEHAARLASQPGHQAGWTSILVEDV